MICITAYDCAYISNCDKAIVVRKDILYQGSSWWMKLQRKVKVGIKQGPVKYHSLNIQGVENAKPNELILGL